MRIRTPLLAIGLTFLSIAIPVKAEQAFPVSSLPDAPQIDGDAKEWGTNWLDVAVKPAREDDDKNSVGEITVQLQAAVVGEEFFLIARWPDKDADTEYRHWEWKGNKYKRVRSRDDMFAVRFDMGGDFNACMVADADYKVDTWLWSAGRSDIMNYATDGYHIISLNMITDAAEYKTPTDNTVYIKKWQDEGVAGFENTRPGKKKTEDTLPSIEFPGAPTGSIADVGAKGKWQDGFWTLEFKRKLNTGHDDDVALPATGTITGQIAVFDKNNADHKSFSDPLIFDFSAR